MVYKLIKSHYFIASKSSCNLFCRLEIVFAASRAFHTLLSSVSIYVSITSRSEDAPSCCSHGDELQEESIIMRSQINIIFIKYIRNIIIIQGYDINILSRPASNQKWDL
jgi:5'(3')-deoxyribonucleotidase